MEEGAAGRIMVIDPAKAPNMYGVTKLDGSIHPVYTSDEHLQYNPAYPLPVL
ncbi:hypothetical protein D3C78_1977640 [compost metagenome]